MDHHGLLVLTRTLTQRMYGVGEAVRMNRPYWKWRYTTVVQPESRCPFCLGVMRSPYIWFLSGLRNNKLHGILDVESGKPSIKWTDHPHALDNSGQLCLGGFTNGIDLLCSPANLNDTPMGSSRIPTWQKLYWNHECQEAYDYLRQRNRHLLDMNGDAIPFPDTGVISYTVRPVAQQADNASTTTSTTEEGVS